MKVKIKCKHKFIFGSLSKLTHNRTQVFTFKKKFCAGNFIQGFGRQNWSAVNVWCNAPLGFADILQSGPKIVYQKRFSRNSGDIMSQRRQTVLPSLISSSG